MNLVFRILKDSHTGKGLPLGSIFLAVPVEREASAPSVRDALHNIVVLNTPYALIDEAKAIYERPVYSGADLTYERRFYLQVSGFNTSILARLAGQRTVDIEWAVLRPLIFDRTTGAMAIDAAIGL